jgi:hypothetical protein
VKLGDPRTSTLDLIDLPVDKHHLDRQCRKLF